MPSLSRCVILGQMEKINENVFEKERELSLVLFRSLTRETIGALENFIAPSTSQRQQVNSFLVTGLLLFTASLVL